MRLKDDKNVVDISFAGGALVLAADQRIQLTDDQNTGNINRLLTFKSTYDVDRPAISWIDETGLHVGALHYHTRLNQQLGGTLLQQFELKTIASQSGPNPADQRTRWTVGTQAQRVKVGVVYSDVFEIYQGENPITVGEGAPSSFGIVFRTDPQDVAQAGAQNFQIGSILSQIDATDNAFMFIDCNPPYQVGNLLPGNKGAQIVFFRNSNLSSASNPKISIKKGDGTNTDAIVITAKSGTMTLIGPLGINGSAAPSKPTISGSRGSATATVLGSVLTALANMGILTDSTTA